MNIKKSISILINKYFLIYSKIKARIKYKMYWEIK